jgi:hypothetical protein
MSDSFAIPHRQRLVRSARPLRGLGRRVPICSDETCDSKPDRNGLTRSGACCRACAGQGGCASHRALRRGPALYEDRRVGQLAGSRQRAERQYDRAERNQRALSAAERAGRGRGWRSRPLDPSGDVPPAPVEPAARLRRRRGRIRAPHGPNSVAATEAPSLPPGSTDSMAEIPIPPPCSHCGGAVGLWEPVVVAASSGGMQTTWLRLVQETTPVPAAIWHLPCHRESTS